MKKIDLGAAVFEAHKFIDACTKLREAFTDRGGHQDQTYYDACPKQQGAVRRASMDLTRALAELRKP